MNERNIIKEEKKWKEWKYTGLALRTAGSRGRQASADMEEIEEIGEMEEMKETEELIDIRERIKIKGILKLTELKINQKSIIKWFNDSIIEKKGTKVRRSILYANYVSYCEENDLIPRKKSEVFVYIHGAMDTLVKNGGYHYFNGYELKN